MMMKDAEIVYCVVLLYINKVHSSFLSWQRQDLNPINFSEAVTMETE